MTSDIDELHVETGGRRRPSLVWIVPLLAIAIAVGVAWQNYASQGPVIEISFADGSGIRSGETELRYRDIAVGLVEGVDFSDDLTKVIVSVRVDQKIAPFVDEGSAFWIVRPEVTAQGVSGLDTVLSGIYIEGDWDGDVGVAAAVFEGQDRPPLITGNQRGKQIVLRSAAGLPSAGTPILYRGVDVGRMGDSEVSEDGQIITAEAVIYEPYDRLVSSSTRFWDISGVSFSLGATGASLDFSSLASLIAGGVAFETLASGGQAIEDGAAFELYGDEESARRQFMILGETGGLDFQVVFEENLAGLSVGSAVNLGGVRIGEVTAIAGVADEDRFGDGRVRLTATLRLFPSRIGFESQKEGDDFVDFLDRRIQEGLRARLANASLLTGGLRIELIEDDSEGPAPLQRNADPFPIIPTVAPNVTDVSASAQGLLQRVEALPVEDVLQGVIDFLDASTALLRNEDLQAAPADLRAALVGVRGVAENEDLAALPGNVSGLIENLNDTATRINGLLDEVEQAALVATLAETLEGFSETADALPALAEQASAILSEAEDLSLQDLIGRVTTLVTTAEDILAQDSTRELPEQLNAALSEMRGALEDLRSGGLIENANTTLASARDAAEAIAEASESLPALSARLSALAVEADAALGDYGRDGAVGRSVSSALRQIEGAAASLDRLATQIARNPNSLLTGR